MASIATQEHLALMFYRESHLRVMLSKALTAGPKVRTFSDKTSLLPNLIILEYSHLYHQASQPIRNEIYPGQR